MDSKILKPLSPKHRAFLAQYIQLWNGTKAYQVVYPGANENVARSAAADLLAKPNIQAHLQLLMAERLMTPEEALEGLTEIARGSAGDFISADSGGFAINLLDVDPATGEVKPKPQTKLIKRVKLRTQPGKYGDSSEVEFEMYDAKDAREKILKLHGRFGGLDKQPANNGQSDKVFSLPADVIAPDFIKSYRAVRSGKYSEFLEYGGRGSTKSSFISLMIIELIKNNPSMHAMAMRQVADTMRDSVFAQLKWAVEWLGLSDEFKFTVSPMEVTYIPTGQKIYFRGADDPGKIKSIKPVFGYIGILWFEELDQFHGAEAVRTIEQSIRGGEKIYMFKSWNPPRTTASWVTKYAMVPKAGQWQHKSDYRDVPEEWLGQPWLDEAKHLAEVNPKAYDHEYLGIANGNGGMVFENVVTRRITDEEIAQFDHIRHGLDWGYFPDPVSFGKMHYDAARCKLYIFGEYRANKKSNRQVWDELISNGLITVIKDKKGNPTGYPDLIIADSAEPKSIGDFRDYGANIRGAEKGPDSVDYSIKWLQSLVEIIIDPVRCPYHAEEFLSYELEQDKNGEFISAYPDKNNHAIDDVRYALNLIWRRRGE